MSYPYFTFIDNMVTFNPLHTFVIWSIKTNGCMYEFSQDFVGLVLLDLYEFSQDFVGLVLLDL